MQRDAPAVSGNRAPTQGAAQRTKRPRPRPDAEISCGEVSRKGPHNWYFRCYFQNVAQSCGREKEPKFRGIAAIAIGAVDQGAGDASGLPFSMTKVSISLVPDTEQPSWGICGDVSYELPALRVWSGFPSILSTKSPCMT